MTTDRQRTEQLLLLEMLVSILVDGVTDKGHPEAIETAACLSRAISETVAGLTIEHRQKLYARRDRLDLACVVPFRSQGQPVAVFGLAVYHLLDAATRTGYLVIGEASALGAALDRLLPALQPTAEDAAANAAAEKTARGMLARLIAAGYFAGLTIPDDRESADA